MAIQEIFETFLVLLFPSPYRRNFSDLLIPGDPPSPLLDLGPMFFGRSDFATERSGTRRILSTFLGSDGALFGFFTMAFFLKKYDQPARS